MILKNGFVVTDDFEIKKLDIKIDGSCITEMAECITGEDMVDCSNFTVVPGFIDIHNHGFGGYSTTDLHFDALNNISKSLIKFGITTYLPTTISDFEDNLIKQVSHIASCKGKVSGTKIGGINLEGPFLSFAKRGAHDEHKLFAPSYDEFMRIQAAAGGIIKTTTIAPELDGALEAIKYISESALVSLGHSDATYEQTLSGFAAGAKNVTHFGNAVSQMTQRSPNFVGTVLDALPDDATIELICDGHHLHPAFIRLAFKVIGAERINLISDSSRLAGIGDGVYEEFGSKITVKNGLALNENGVITSSTTNVYNCFINAIKFGVSFLDAIKTVTINPARTIKCCDKIGSIKVGKQADIVILNNDLAIKKVFVDGVLH